MMDTRLDKIQQKIYHNQVLTRDDVILAYSIDPENGLVFEDMSGNKIGAVLTDLDLSNLELPGINLSYSDVTDTKFNGSNLEDSSFTGAVGLRANFTETNLKKSRMNMTIITGAVFIDANLEEARLTTSHLEGAVFTSAILKKTDLSYTFLCTANLIWVKAQEANFDHAEMLWINANGGNFSGAYLGFTKIQWHAHPELYLRKIWAESHHLITRFKKAASIKNS